MGGVILKQDKKGNLTVANNGESKMQQGCVKWFRLQHAKYRKVFFAIPNGGKRTDAEAQVLIGEGVVPGVADCFLSLARKGFFGMYVEFKYGKGKLSEAQELFKADVEKHGYKYVVCYTVDEFMREITFYLN